MKTVLSTLELVEPRSLADALRLLADRQPLVPLAGCTDLFVSLNAGMPPASRYLDLWPLDQLRKIRVVRGVLSIGALATFSDLIGSSLVKRHVPILAEAARQIGAVQIQNRGTLGGNVVNASPAGDSLPVLAAAEATLVLQSAEGTRRVPFTAFYTGYRRTVMRSDELLVAIEVPPVEGRQWFRKVGTRAAQAISKVVMAAVRAPHPRIALGSVAPTVVRVPRTEAVLASGGSIEEAQAVLQTEIQPIDDLRSTAAYRRRVSANLLAAFWRQTCAEEKRA
jgi:xanthine dehydrogenase small subunit